MAKVLVLRVRNETQVARVTAHSGLEVPQHIPMQEAVVHASQLEAGEGSIPEGEGEGEEVPRMKEVVEGPR